VHSTHYTAANEPDVPRTHEVRHAQEDHVFLDAGHMGVQKREDIVKAQADGSKIHVLTLPATQGAISRRGVIAG